MYCIKTNSALGKTIQLLLVQIIEIIKESIDSGKFGCGIFIDLLKAFDTVNHEILLNKLEHHGVRG